jgi:uncharacterized membrane protein
VGGEGEARAEVVVRHRHPANIVRHDRRDFGQRAADRVTAGFGSWSFIIVQTVFVTIWIALNVIAYVREWDPYPFILLNLAFSTQAAYAAPLILLSQNRTAEHDRVAAEHDYAVNDETLNLIRLIYDEHGALLRELADAAGSSRAS